MTVRDYEHQLRMEISENENRKEFTFSERVDWARRLERVEKEKAKERQGARTDLIGNICLKSDTGRVDERVARESGFGGKDRYREAKYIADHADPEIIGQLDEMAETTEVQNFAPRKGRTRYSNGFKKRQTPCRILHRVKTRRIQGKENFPTLQTWDALAIATQYVGQEICCSLLLYGIIFNNGKRTDGQTIGQTLIYSGWTGGRT